MYLQKLNLYDNPRAQNCYFKFVSGSLNQNLFENGTQNRRAEGKPDNVR